MTARITMYSKPGCHLCDQAHEVIARVAADIGTSYEVVDISTSTVLAPGRDRLHTHDSLAVKPESVQ